MAEGRVAESHDESDTALYLDPTDVLINEHMAWHHMMAREYDRAIPQAIKAVELDPNFVQAHRVLALSYLYSGRVPEACQEFEKGVELSHADPVARAYLARCYAVDHREPEARKILASLEEASKERYISAAEIAAIHVSLNQPDSALEWLDKAIEERSGSLIYLKADRIFDPRRNNPRLQADLSRINLPSKATAPSAQSIGLVR
jgi:Flp pilus assembly protein TadD